MFVNKRGNFSPTDFALQSSLRHIAIIMDGNRRWAAAKGLPPHDGHRQGIEAAVKTMRAAFAHDIECVTLFAFSCANWNRPHKEVTQIFAIADSALRRLYKECKQHDVQIEILGRTDRLPLPLRRRIETITRLTCGATRRLRIALDYSSKEAIFQAARHLPEGASIDQFESLISGSTPSVDLLIRPGNERRLSDFLLWECAYAEIYFCDQYWPEFDHTALTEALKWFHGRNRRYGG